MDKSVRCSFCGRNEIAHDYLVSSESSGICNVCFFLVYETFRRLFERPFPWELADEARGKIFNGPLALK